MEYNRLLNAAGGLVALAVGMSLAACTPCPGPPDQVDIVPGTSMAGIELGRPLQEAIDARGQPSIQGLSFAYDGGITGSVADLNGNRAADPDDIVVEVRALPPYAGRTAGGNGVGSALACVTQEFGMPDLNSTDLVYSAQGIGFIASSRITPQVSPFQILLAALTRSNLSVYEVVVFFDANSPFRAGAVPDGGADGGQ